MLTIIVLVALAFIAYLFVEEDIREGRDSPWPWSKPKEDRET